MERERDRKKEKWRKVLGEKQTCMILYTEEEEVRESKKGEGGRKRQSWKKGV